MNLKRPSLLKKFSSSIPQEMCGGQGGDQDFKALKQTLFLCKQSFGGHLPDESFVHINVNFLSLVSKFFQLEWLTMFSDMNKAKGKESGNEIKMFFVIFSLPFSLWLLLWAQYCCSKAD